MRKNRFATSKVSKASSKKRKANTRNLPRLQHHESKSSTTRQTKLYMLPPGISLANDVQKTTQKYPISFSSYTVKSNTSSPPKLISPTSDSKFLAKDVRSRKSFTDYKARLQNNQKQRPVEKWSHESHKQALKEKDRLAQLIQIERLALVLTKKIDNILTKGIAPGEEEAVAKRIEKIIEDAGIRRGIPRDHRSIQKGLDAVRELMDAVQRRKQERIEKLKAELFAAASTGNADVVTRLVAEEEANVNCFNAEGRTPIEVAALSNHVEAVEAFALHGARFHHIDEASESGVSDTHTAALVINEVVANLSSRCDQKGDEYCNVVKIVSLLLDCGATQNYSNTKPSALSVAVDRNFRAIIDLCCRNHSVTNVINAQLKGSTPLFIAASRGQHELVDLLIEAHANVNETCREGTALFAAASANHMRCVYSLTSAKADVNIKGLELARKANPTSDVSHELESKSAVHREMHLTPIDVAAKHGHILVVKILLETFFVPKKKAHPISKMEKHCVTLDEQSANDRKPSTKADTVSNGTHDQANACRIKKSLSDIIKANARKQPAAHIAALSVDRHQTRKRAWKPAVTAAAFAFQKALKSKSQTSKQLSIEPLVSARKERNAITTEQNEDQTGARKSTKSTKAASEDRRKDFATVVKGVLNKIKSGFRTLSGNALLRAVKQGIKAETSALVNPEIRYEHSAALCGRIKMLTTAMGAHIDSFDKDEKSGLWYAAQQGAVSMCVVLLQHKANIMHRPCNNYTPLAIAAKMGKWHAVPVLCDAIRDTARRFATEEIGVDGNGNELERRKVDHGDICPLLEAVLCFESSQEEAQLRAISMILNLLDSVHNISPNSFRECIRTAVLLGRWKIVKYFCDWDTQPAGVITKNFVHDCAAEARTLIRLIHAASLDFVLQIPSQQANVSVDSVKLEFDKFASIQLDNDSMLPIDKEGGQRILHKQRLKKATTMFARWLSKCYDSSWHMEEKYGDQFDTLNCFSPNILRTIVAVDRITHSFITNNGLEVAVQRAQKLGCTGMVGTCQDLQTAAIQNDVIAILNTVCRANVLVDAMPQEDEQRDEYASYTPLLMAACHNNISALKTLLLLKADINRQASDGMTPLLNACYNGYDEMVDVLLQYSQRAKKTGHHWIDVNLALPGGETACIIAAQQGHEQILSRLLDYQNSVAIADDSHNEAIQTWQQVLNAAIFANHKHVVDVLCAKVDFLKSDSNALTNLLISAVNTGKQWAVSRLLKAKANPNQVSEEGATPMLTAVLRDDSQVLKTLIEAGGLLDVCTDGDGNTAAMTAAFCLNIDVLQLMNEKGSIDHNAKNKNGETISGILWDYHRRQSINEVLSLKQSEVLARARDDAQTNMQEKESLPLLHMAPERVFEEHCAGEAAMSYMQFVVMLANIGLKAVYGDSFDYFAFIMFHIICGNTDANARLSALDVKPYIDKFFFLVASRHQGDAAAAQSRE